MYIIPLDLHKNFKYTGNDMYDCQSGLLNPVDGTRHLIKTPQIRGNDGCPPAVCKQPISSALYKPS